jgi:hypothetical protein
MVSRLNPRPMGILHVFLCRADIALERKWWVDPRQNPTSCAQHRPPGRLQIVMTNQISSNLRTAVPLNPTLIDDAVVSEADVADTFVTVYEEMAAKPDESLAAIRRKFAHPLRRVRYQDLENTMWTAWQVRPQDVTVHHIGHAMYLLARRSEGGIELDRASSEACGIDYGGLMLLIRSSRVNGSDMSAWPKVPRRITSGATTNPPAISLVPPQMEETLPPYAGKREAHVEAVDAGDGSTIDDISPTPQHVGQGLLIAAAGPALPESTTGTEPEPPYLHSGTPGTPFNPARIAKQTRAATVAKLIKELNDLKPRMFDEAEYNELRRQYPGFLTFKTAESRPDLKIKVLAMRGSTRHIRLAQELAAAYHGRELSTIQDDWKDHKPPEFKRQR